MAQLHGSFDIAVYNYKLLKTIIRNYLNYEFLAIFQRQFQLYYIPNHKKAKALGNKMTSAN